MSVFNAAVTGSVQPTVTAEAQWGCCHEPSVQVPN